MVFLESDASHLAQQFAVAEVSQAPAFAEVLAAKDPQILRPQHLRQNCH